MPFALADQAMQLKQLRDYQLQGEAEKYSPENVELRKQQALANTSQAKLQKSAYDRFLDVEGIERELQLADAEEKQAILRNYQGIIRPNIDGIMSGETAQIPGIFQQLAPIPGKEYVINDENGWEGGLQLGLKDTKTGEVTKLKGQTFRNPDFLVKYLADNFLTRKGAVSSATARANTQIAQETELSKKQAENVLDLQKQVDEGVIKEEQQVTPDAVFQELLQDNNIIAVKVKDDSTGQEYTNLVWRSDNPALGQKAGEVVPTKQYNELRSRANEIATYGRNTRNTTGKGLGGVFGTIQSYDSARAKSAAQTKAAIEAAANSNASTGVPAAVPQVVPAPQLEVPTGLAGIAGISPEQLAADKAAQEQASAESMARLKALWDASQRARAQAQQYESMNPRSYRPIRPY